MRGIENLINKCKRLINKYIITSNRLLDVICVPDGLMNILISIDCSNEIRQEDLYNIRLSYDYDYFVFAKSIKTLISIRELLNCKTFCLTEECFSLIRSIFENHILSRRLRERIDTNSEEDRIQLIKDFISAPLGLTFDYYHKSDRVNIVSRDNKQIAKEVTPKSASSEFDNKYYGFLYPFLCQYAHCSFGVAADYLGKGGFTVNNDNENKLLAYALSIFSFSKVYQGVVTVNGEDFIEKKHMKRCYDLAYDSLEFQMILFDALIEYYNSKPITQSQKVMQCYLGEKDINYSNQKIAKMLCALKESLIDPKLSSLYVDECNNGKFVRRYADF